MAAPRVTTRGVFDEIRANRRRSSALAVTVGALLALVGGSFGALYGEPLLGVVFASVFAIAFLTVAWFGGARMTLAASGARRADPERDRRLLNVVQEVAIAAGLEPPEVWVIDDSAPNAFATGRDPGHAALAITTGLGDKLDRDELQGVIAHELSHIRNYDIRYTTFVAATVGAIALVADVALRHMWWGGGPRRSRNREINVVFIILAVVVAVLAPLSARVLQAAISRRRETLADLGAAELTRYPEALARALEKIEADNDVLEAANRATAPLYIVHPLLEGGVRSVFRTHPPTAERVRLLRGLTTGGAAAPADPAPA